MGCKTEIPAVVPDDAILWGTGNYGLSTDAGMSINVPEITCRFISGRLLPVVARAAPPELLCQVELIAWNDPPAAPMTDTMPTSQLLRECS